MQFLIKPIIDWLAYKIATIAVRAIIKELEKKDVDVKDKNL